MAEYFNNPQDLKGWVKSRGSYGEAYQELISLMGEQDSEDVQESCRAIFEKDDDSASEVLFGVLAKHNITTLNKQASNMKKTAQSTSRQRNEWSKGERNKWNRCVDGFNDGTPWRVGRDKYYDFTHYYTDEVKFDEDPNHIYSGESIWRTYIMDKFYRDYKDEDGHVVGGYINDRFHVFPDAGTPANPGVPRDGGNQMSLADGERTRMPRPHEYSTERRLEEARGNKLQSVTASTAFSKVIKVASVNNRNLKEARKDKIYNIFKDTIEMREAGIDYGTMIDKVADHYGASLLGVAQIDKVAQKLIAKHEGVGYSANVRIAVSLSEALSGPGGSTMQVVDPTGASAILNGDGNNQVHLDTGTVFVPVPNMPNVFEITDHPVNASMVGSRVSFANMDFDVSAQPYIQQAADELGLNEGDIEEVKEALQMETAQALGSDDSAFGSDFDISEI